MTGNVRALFSGSPRYPSGTLPVFATQPTSSDPRGSTVVRSSLTMHVPGAGVNVPVVTLPPAVVTCVIWPPPSDDPMPSRIIACGTWARNRSFNVEFSGAPPDRMMNSDDRSYAPVSISSRIGRANESPTIWRKLIFSRSTSERTSLGSSRRTSSWTGTVHERRGGTHAHRALLRSVDHGRQGLVRHPGHGTAHHRHEDVVLSPQHALRHAGGATRVEDVEVVGRPRRRARGQRR